MTRRAYCLAAVLLGVLAGTAGGLIERIYALQEVLNESSHVLVGHVESVDAKARTAVAVVDQVLKGKAERKRIRMNIGLGPAHHAKYLVERLEPGAPAILFYKREGTNIACLVHAADLWFQLFATDEPEKRDRIWWRFTHIEEHMGRTFDGSTKDLVKLTGDVLAGRAKPPRPDPKVPRLDATRSVARRGRPGSEPGKEGGFYRRAEFAHDGGGEIRGVSCADVNGDDQVDLLLCRQKGNVLLVNQGDGFQEMGRPLGAEDASRAASWADYNGDDHPDLLTNNFTLFTNIGGKMRKDSALIPAPKGRNPEGAGWIDYDGDGLPDVLITNGEHGIQLYRNTGENPKAFLDVSGKAGLGPKGLGVGNGDFVVFFDYDGDGYTDFLYNLGKGVLAHNQGDGTFRIQDRSGIDLPGGSDYKRGIAVADFDNDGDLDLFVPGQGKPRLYRNNNDGTFTDVLDASGDLAGAKDASFAAAWGDSNSDGFPDLFVCHTGRQGRLYLGDGKGRFTDVSAETGVEDLAPAFGALFADVDGDGDLDLVVNQPGRIVVASNDMPRPKGCGVVTVRVQARKGLVGATVRALDEKGRPLGLRELSGADGPGGQASPVAHFALPVGKARLSVCLSDGRVAQRTIAVQPTHSPVTFREADFK